MYAVSILAEEGRIINQFVRRNIRAKETFGGTCTKCESIKAPFLVKEVKKNNHLFKVYRSING